MISPDIDGESFQARARMLQTLPGQFLIIALRQDRALQLSVLLTGHHTRLGPPASSDLSWVTCRSRWSPLADTSRRAIAITKRLDAQLLPGAPHGNGLLGVPFPVLGTAD